MKTRSVIVVWLSRLGLAFAVGCQPAASPPTAATATQATAAMPAEEPGANPAPPSKPGPAETLRRVILAADSGDLVTVWRFLPKSLRDDVARTLVEQLSQIRLEHRREAGQVVYRLAAALIQHGELARRMTDQPYWPVEPERFERQMVSVMTLTQALGQTVAPAQAADWVEVLLGNEGALSVTFRDMLQHSPSPLWKQMTALEIDEIEVNAERARLELRPPGSAAGKGLPVELALVEDHWIPLNVVEGWPTLRDAWEANTNWLAKPEVRQEIEQGLRAIGGRVSVVEKARTPSEFFLAIDELFQRQPELQRWWLNHAYPPLEVQEASIVVNAELTSAEREHLWQQFSPSLGPALGLATLAVNDGRTVWRLNGLENWSDWVADLSQRCRVESVDEATRTITLQHEPMPSQ